MHEVRLFVGLLVAVVLVAVVAGRSRLPQPVALVLGGLVIGVLPFAPDVRLDPDVIFLAFLPPILYPTAFRYATEDVRTYARPVGFLAIGLTLATIAVIGVVVHVATGIPLAACFVLGSVLGPTDPVAATAALRSAGAPGRVAAILEGESLVNDATSLTALGVTVGAVGAGTFSLWSSSLDFVAVAGGGVVVGVVLALGVIALRRRLDDLELEAAIAVLLAYGSFVLAETIGVSGILATVTAGWVVGRRSADIASPETRAGGTSFWVVAQFLGESMLFLLVGIAFGQVLGEDAGRSVLELAGLTALVTAVIVAFRFAWMFTVPHLAGVLDRQTHHFESFVDRRERIAIAAGGMRGAVSVAAALTIPLTVAGGEPFPDRDTFIIVAFSSIVLLLVGPALLMPPLLRRLDLVGAGEAEEVERDARVRLIHAALGRAEELAAHEEVPEEVLERIRERYEWRLRRAGAEADGHETDIAPETYRRVRQELLKTERDELQELRRSGEVTGDAVRSIERDLDLESQRIG